MPKSSSICLTISTTPTCDRQTEKHRHRVISYSIYCTSIALCSRNGIISISVKDKDFVTRDCLTNPFNILICDIARSLRQLGMLWTVVRANQKRSHPPTGMGQLGAADSAPPIRRGQLGNGTIRRRANSTRAIRRGDISARRL